MPPAQTHVACLGLRADVDRFATVGVRGPDSNEKSGMKAPSSDGASRRRSSGQRDAELGGEGRLACRAYPQRPRPCIPHEPAAVDPRRVDTRLRAKEQRRGAFPSFEECERSKTSSIQPTVLPPIVRRIVVLSLPVLLALVAAAAHAAGQPPSTFKGHGVRFSYPGNWLELSGSVEAHVGNALWAESVGPTQTAPADPSQPTTTHRPLVTLASYRSPVSITAKNIGRYRAAIVGSVTQLVGQVHGRMESGPARVSMGRLPGYRFQITATLGDGVTIRSRLVYVFRRRTEYFLNCQYAQNDQLASETEAGCDQVMRSFRLGSTSRMRLTATG